MENVTGLKSLERQYKKMDLCRKQEDRRTLAYLGARTTLKLSFNVPRKRRSTKLMQYNIIAEGVDVFGIDEQPIHVEQAGPHRRKASIHVLVNEHLEGGRE